jgi:hypothetical protein
MKKIYLIIYVALFCIPMQAQIPVTDVASLSNDMFSFGIDVAEQFEHSIKLGEYLMLTQEALEKLQEVSNYVQQAKISLEIIQEGNKLAQQIKTIQTEMSQLSSLTDQEIANAICMAADLGEMIAQKVEQISETIGQSSTSSNNQSTAELNDYERLQLLQNIKAEIINLQDMLSKVQKRFQATDSKEQLQEYLSNLTMCAVLYGITGGEGTITPESVAQARQEMNKASNAKTTTKTTSTKSKTKITTTSKTKK